MNYLQYLKNRIAHINSALIEEESAEQSRILILEKRKVLNEIKAIEWLGTAQTVEEYNDIREQLKEALGDQFQIFMAKIETLYDTKDGKVIGFINS